MSQHQPEQVPEGAAVAKVDEEDSRRTKGSAKGCCPLEDGPLARQGGPGGRLSVSALSIISATSDVKNRLKRATSGCGWRAYFLPVFLCLYSVLKEIKVGEPYLYKYQTEYLNLTAEQITGEVYPFTPYAYLAALVPIFLLTDLLLYKPTMLAEVLGQIGFRATLVFGGSVLSQVFGQIFYGIASASEVAFFSYIYARLEKDQYRRLTSWTRAGTMAGRTGGYLFAQLLVLTRLGNLHTLNVIAFGMPCLVLVFCILLPRVHWKTMVGRMLEAKGRVIRASSAPSPSHLPRTYSAYLLYRVRKLRSDFMKIYSVGHIRKWSLWWAMTTCMSLQVALFSQTLWGDVQKGQSGESPLNGFAEAAYTATATLAILAMNAIPMDWDKWGELALVLISTLDAALLFLYSRTQSIWIMYGCYICYRSLYQVMITIAQWNIARKMMCESYGLVFGVNSFIALLMQSVLTMVVTDKRGLGLDVRPQYVIYALLHSGIALIFLASVLFTLTGWLLRRQQKSNSRVMASQQQQKGKGTPGDALWTVPGQQNEGQQQKQRKGDHERSSGSSPSSSDVEEDSIGGSPMDLATAEEGRKGGRLAGTGSGNGKHR